MLERELQRNSDTLTRLASGPAKADPGDLSDLHERMGLGERRLTEIAEERLALARTIVSREEVAQVRTAFDPLWDKLTIREQAHIVNLLLLALDIQEALLTLQHRLRGLDLKRGKHGRHIAVEPDWQVQRVMWGDSVDDLSGAG